MAYVGGSYTYNPSGTGPQALISQLRQIVPDYDFTRVPTGAAGEQVSVLFSDEEYQNFLTWNQNDPVYALCQALLTIANNRALLAIHVSLGGGGEVDWAPTAPQLRAQVQAIRENYATLPAEAYAEINYGGGFSWSRIAWNSILKSGF